MAPQTLQSPQRPLNLQPGQQGGWGPGARVGAHRGTPLCAWAPQSFHFPLFMTMLHLAVIFLFSALSRALVQCSSHRARVVLSWPDYLRRVAPTGARLPVGRREGAAQRGRKEGS